MSKDKEHLLIDLWAVNMDEIDTSGCTDIEDILSAVITYLSELPTVDAVPVAHGRWLSLEEYGEKIGADVTKSEYPGAWVFCSECGQQMRNIDGWLYCPNCGAKMDGDENG